MVERRKVVRREVDLSVTFFAEGKKQQTRARQLSEYGILVGPLQDPTTVLPKRVEVEFALPGQKPFHLKGSVVYVTGTSAGIRFDSVPKDVHAVLKEFVNQPPPA